MHFITKHELSENNTETTYNIFRQIVWTASIVPILRGIVTKMIFCYAELIQLYQGLCNLQSNNFWLTSCPAEWEPPITREIFAQNYPAK